MATDILHLMATISPDVFCQAKARAKTKAALNHALATGDKMGYFKAAQIVLPCEPNAVALEQLWECNGFDLPGQRSPVEQHVLTLDNPAEPLEPIYFDLLHELMAQEGWTVEKMLDTASATPGSGLSLDLNRRALVDQHEAGRLLILLQSRIRAFVQEWQKWHEQKRQLTFFAQARTPDDPARATARQRLSHQWQQGDYGAGADREAAFESWLPEAEAELRTQIDLARDLLAGDLRLLKLQANWLKPYLQPQQSSRHAGNPALVTGFNTAVFEVVLLVGLDLKLEQRVRAGELPKMLLNPKCRRGRPGLLIEMKFLTIPERTPGSAYAYRGRAQITITSFALNDDELAVLRRELQRSEWGEVLSLLETNASGKLDALLNDLDELLVEPKAERGKSAESAATSDPNPFTALFDFSDWFGSEAREATNRPVEPLKPDSASEAVIRSLALLEARQQCLELYERCKQMLKLPGWKS